MRQPSVREHQGSDFGWVPEHDGAWRRVLGPLLSIDEVQLRLGLVTHREVDDMVRRKQLLALPTREGRVVYPAFQFDEQGRVLPGIDRIIRIFDGIALTPYTIASWLNGPKEYLDGETPIRWLQLERDVDPVIAGAEVAAARLSHQILTLRPLARPPADLSGFPGFLLSPGHELFRIHQAVYGPWWFSCGGPLRFDLACPRGTCYLAEQDLGAFVEAFQDWTGIIIPQVEVDARRIARVHVPTSFRLADCTHPGALRFGVTAEIHSSPERVLTQAWAEALDRAGLDGVRFFVRHDPAQQHIGIAVFGAAGETPWHVDGIEAISSVLIDNARTHFGIEVGQPRPVIPFLMASLLGVMLQNRLDLDEQRVFFESRVRRPTATIFIPDVMVVPTASGARLIEDPGLANFTDPLPLVAEEWSPSTGDYDTAAKIPVYRQRGDAEI